VSVLENMRTSAGLVGYLAAVEGRLAAAVASHPGVVAGVAIDSVWPLARPATVNRIV
jgi:hypothetical protein